MSSPSVLDVDALVQPIPGPNPAGIPIPDGLARALNDACKEPDPFDPPPPPEWGKLVREAADVFANTSKDLVLAVRLVQAVTNKEGVPGLRDGLRLLHRVVSECADRVHPGPPADRDMMEAWRGLFEVLNTKFPQTVAGLPLIKVDGRAFSTLDLHFAERKAELDQLTPKVKPEAIRRIHEDLTAAMKALQDLTASLDERLTHREVGRDGDERKEVLAPDFLSTDGSRNLGSVIKQCLEMVEDVAKQRGVPLGDQSNESPPQSSTGDAPHATDPTPGPVTVASTRDGLYRQLRQLAEALKVIEPHSPVPFLLERCVKLGAMPFPELIKSIVTEQAAITELERLLGITPAS